jgi:hypothetical protein
MPIVWSGSYYVYRGIIEPREQPMPTYTVDGSVEVEGSWITPPKRREIIRARLVKRQTTAELERKASIASRRQRIWTEEELDLARRLAAERWPKLTSE